MDLNVHTMVIKVTSQLENPQMCTVYVKNSVPTLFNPLLNRVQKVWPKGGWVLLYIAVRRKLIE